MQSWSFRPPTRDWILLETTNLKWPDFDLIFVFFHSKNESCWLEFPTWNILILSLVLIFLFDLPRLSATSVSNCTLLVINMNFSDLPIPLTNPSRPDERHPRESPHLALQQPLLFFPIERAWYSATICRWRRNVQTHCLHCYCWGLP